MSTSQQISFTVEALEPGDQIHPEDLCRFIVTLNNLLAHGDLDLRIAEYAAANEKAEYGWGRSDFDAIAGRLVTDDEVKRIVKAIEHSSAGEVIADAVRQAFGFPLDEDDEN
jgi:hypothetical protein